MVKVLLTGASGFLGGGVLERLAGNSEVELTAAMRGPVPSDLGARGVVIGGIDGGTDWDSALQGGVDVVVHCAARVHVMQDNALNPLEEFRKVNVMGTLRLARQAVQRGARRFVFISSVKVNGEGTAAAGPAYTTDDIPAPQDPYGVSKMEAEQQLRLLAVETGLEVVIIRPVLIYGPGVKANFESMLRWVSRGIPLPLGAIRNQRSLVALDNVVDLIVTCVDHPAAANQTFMVSDGEDLSTSDLLLRVGRALGRPARLLPAPTWLLKIAAMILGRPGIAQRLCESLQVDISKTRQRLGWQPPVSVDEGLRLTAQYYFEHQRT